MIEERQNQLNMLYSETFGREAGGQGGKDAPVSEADYDVSNLVFNRNAKPPQDKLKKALRNKKFRETLELERTDIEDNSLSGYDASLATLTAGYGWNDQEIVNLGIAFRRENGNEEDLKKALRPDYWGYTLALARGKGKGGLRRLQSEIKEIVLYGADEEGEFVIDLKDGKSINMGDASAFLSPSRAYQRLYIAGFVLTPQEKKRWPQVVRDWRPSIRIETTVTKLTEFEQWMINDVSRGGTIPPMIDPENLSRSLDEATSNSYTGVGLRGYTTDKEGRLYVHIPSILASAQMMMGRHLSGKRIAGYLRRMRFENIENLSVSHENYHHEKHTSRVTIWASPARFTPKDLYIGREVDGDTEEKGDSTMKLSPTPLEEAARKVRERGI